MKLWLFVIVVTGFCSGLFGLNYLWSELSQVKEDKLILEARAEAYEINAALVQEQLELERKVREAAQVALSDLKKVVSHEEYNQQVPPGIQRVLDEFNSSLRTDGM
jgi:hypothetical protein